MNYICCLFLINCVKNNKFQIHEQKKEGFYLNMANYLNSRDESTLNTNFIGGKFK